MTRDFIMVLISGTLIGAGWLALSSHEQKTLNPLVPKNANTRWSVNAVALAPTLPPPDEMTRTICDKIRAVRPDLTESFCLIGVSVAPWGRLDVHSNYYAVMTQTGSGAFTIFKSIHDCAMQIEEADKEDFTQIYNPTLHNPFSDLYHVVPDSEACRVASGYHDETAPKLD